MFGFSSNVQNMNDLNKLYEELETMTQSLLFAPFTCRFTKKLLFFIMRIVFDEHRDVPFLNVLDLAENRLQNNNFGKPFKFLD